jgi:hypothetical protein
MKYEDTGQFTQEQEKLAKEISTRLRKLRQLGCVLIAKQDRLCAYLDEDYINSDECGDYNFPTPCLDCGRIDDAGADDTMYFENGYIG